MQCIRFVAQLPTSRTYDIIGRQLLRAATAVGANYRATCRARSRADFVSKIGVVEEEADESAFWLELLNELHAMDRDEGNRLLHEANELTAIFAASEKTAKYNRHSSLDTQHSTTKEVRHG